MKSKVAAALFALFLGPLGIHWFYLKKTGKGLTYLLLSCLIFTIPIFLIICFIEFIIFLTMDDNEFNEKYNKVATTRLDELKKLHELLEIGAITQEEFESKKQNFL